MTGDHTWDHNGAMRPFADRAEAGRAFAGALHRHADADTVVLGLPRGGVPVAYEVARALGAPLDVLVVRKLGVPHHPELAFGAIGEGGVRVLNDVVVHHVGLSENAMAAVEEAERAELQRRVEVFRGGRRALPLTGRTVIVVDDGFATGATARAAALVARAHGARRVVLAAPIGAPDTLAALRQVADEVVCLGAPAGFTAVGQGYRHFDQTPDEVVCDLLADPPVG